MKEYAILLDSTYCTGCNTCMYKCIQENRLEDPASRGLFRTWVQINDHGLYHHRCMHCSDPACVAACKEACGDKPALTKSAYGPVLYDAKLCIGCGGCEDSCPFEVPHLDDATNKMVKCSMCAHRIQEGRVPACVEACPTNAMVFGEYRDILAKATERAKAQKLKIYGLKENGGGHFLVLAPEPIQAGYPKVALSPVKGKQVAGLEVKTPALLALGIGGLKKFSDRRNRIETEE
ncbi:4Fe-4S dicluster domain-containing protein [Dethiosulfatarculus sandiegensis]|uniref:4Fe-4S ferredoxin n=1 Tax=Dethiosulfatarculus sandiegensis TaxID=1429043 RepID=A0A0D2HZD3_9BACT|nr:4Fe-4S dicluster domain-containing protein [Dethiosulfatarculus sandiegensis]KIX15618.1 4Fe-4S ferredoxin [Dethiosulfatarculus sandiegensis]